MRLVVPPPLPATVLHYVVAMHGAGAEPTPLNASKRKRQSDVRHSSAMQLSSSLSTSNAAEAPSPPPLPSCPSLPCRVLHPHLHTGELCGLSVIITSPSSIPILSSLRFGHPSPEVTERLAAAGVRVYRTDRDGAITASTDGSALSVRTFLHPSK